MPEQLAARNLAAMLDVPLTEAVDAVRRRDLAAVTANRPLPVSCLELVDAIAVPLAAADSSMSLDQLRRAVFCRTILSIVRQWHPTLTSVAGIVDDGDPPTAVLTTVTVSTSSEPADGVELDSYSEVSLFATPAGDEAFPWVAAAWAVDPEGAPPGATFGYYP